MEIKEDMLDAIEVKFLQPIFSEDFVERGMVAWLVNIQKTDKDCWKLHFNFKDFEDYNDIYFIADYLDSKGIACLTAKDKGLYKQRYSVYFGRTDIEKYGSFEEQIKDYLIPIEEN